MGKKIMRAIEAQVCGLMVREAGEGQEESRMIVGHAVVWGQRSVNLTPWSSQREVYEVMERGCMDDELLKRSDVVLTAYHDNSKILGRWRRGEGTLELEIDATGLVVRCELAKTATGDEMLELIRRGDVKGMSFCFTADENDSENGVSYEKTEEKGEGGKEVWLRHVKKVEGLYDVTIVGHPAYEGTDVEAREIEAAIAKNEAPSNSPNEGENPGDTGAGGNEAAPVEGNEAAPGLNEPSAVMSEAELREMEMDIIECEIENY